MNAIFAVKPAIADTSAVKTQPPITGQIEFRNLTFRYHANDLPVLRDINLTIPAGQSWLSWDEPAAASRLWSAILADS